MPEIAERVRAWGPRACRATGTDSDIQRQAAEDEYARVLHAMEKQLSETSYMLGDRPTAVDCVLLGGLRAHTNMDPDPKEVIANFPRVVDWCENSADQWQGEGELAPFPESTEFARFVLKEMVTTYQPYVIANAQAQAAGAKAFHINVYDEDVSFLSRPYPEQSRQMISDNITNRLNEKDKQLVNGWLTRQRLEKCFVR